jgi:hypothetical protein
MATRGRFAIDKNPDLVERCEQDIWSGLADADELAVIMQRAVKTAEEVCREVLEAM